MPAKDKLLVHIDALYRYALHLVNDKNDADDLVQETYLKAFNFIKKSDKDVINEKAWLFKILVNTFINRYRKEKSSPSLVDFDNIESFYNTIEEEAFASTIPEDEMRLSELLDAEINNAMEGLHVDFRTAILLSIVEGFSYKEISEMLDCPIGTVMSRIYRGRKILKETLAAYARKNGFIRGKEGKRDELQ